MSGGRRAVVLAAGWAAALALALPGPASAFPRFPQFPRVQVRTDGTLTVGQQETLYVTRVPRRPKMRIAGYISAPPTASNCFASFDAYCAPEPLYAVPGTPRLKASKKGRATLTFVMPPAYEFLDLDDPLRSHAVTLINEQTVHVDMEGTMRRGRTTFTADVGHAIAVVEVPPAPPAS